MSIGECYNFDPLSRVQITKDYTQLCIFHHTQICMLVYYMGDKKKLKKSIYGRTFATMKQQ